ncbi:MAG: hypothetical protein XD84_2116 [Desulfotomaculum sp. 46_80]|nr:MAG: hypothetical protein XD84_2116 [Desulfotomaculum sp. 46_80]
MAARKTRQLTGLSNVNPPRRPVGPDVYMRERMVTAGSEANETLGKVVLFPKGGEPHAPNLPVGGQAGPFHRQPARRSCRFSHMANYAKDGRLLGVQYAGTGELGEPLSVR